MYAIEVTEYGLRLTFSGAIELPEMQKWSNELKEKILKQKEGFGVLVDVREMELIRIEALNVVVETQAFAKEHGTGRNANIVRDSISKLQQTRFAYESGLYSYMRYIDGTSKQAEKIALDWIIRGIDPDKRFVKKLLIWGGVGLILITSILGFIFLF